MESDLLDSRLRAIIDAGFTSRLSVEILLAARPHSSGEVLDDDLELLLCNYKRAIAWVNVQAMREQLSHAD